VLSSVVASAATGYAAGRAPTLRLHAEAAVHGYTVAFWVAAGVFAVGAVLVGATMRSIRVQPEPAPEPLPA
jgi:hypothetical protein